MIDQVSSWAVMMRWRLSRVSTSRYFVIKGELGSVKEYACIKGSL
jgi:hypothetical protein